MHTEGDLLQSAPRCAGPSSPGNAAFLTSAIGKLREKLINISKANPLIAFKHSERGASFVRIINETLSDLYDCLSAARSMTFEPLPDPRVEPADQKTPAFRLALERARLSDATYADDLARAGGDSIAADAAEAALIRRVRAELGLPQLDASKAPDLVALAKAHGIDPSFDLPALPRGQHHVNDAIRVLMLPDKLERRLRTIADRYRGHSDQTGIHTLQLVLGFLEWREKDDAQAVHHAPLLTLEVDLVRSGIGGRIVYTVRGRGEPLALNMALREMLRRFYNVILQGPDVDETPEAWFEKVTPLLAEVPGLKVKRWATLAVLPFPNMAVWRDLDPEVWPDLEEQPHVRLLLGASDTGDNGDGFPPDHPIDELPLDRTPPLVTDADVSQHSAIVDVASGKSLAIEGPPGTGKSQTIANLIASALSQGRRVLFVAEKRAALEVVATRLKAVGLGPLLLELHSDKARKADVLDAFGQALASRAEAARAGKSGKGATSERDQLVQHRQLLRAYQFLLRKPLGALGATAGDLVWREMRLRERVASVLPRPVWDLSLEHAPETTPLQLRDRRAALTALERAHAVAEEAGVGRSGWRGAQGLPTDPIGQQRLLDFLFELGSAVAALSSWRDEVSRYAGEVSDRPDALLSLTRPFSDATPPSDCRADVLKAALADDADVSDLANGLERHLDVLERLRARHSAPLEASLDAIEGAVAAVSAVGLQQNCILQVTEALTAAQTVLDRMSKLRAAIAPVAAALELDFQRLTLHQTRMIAAAVAELARLNPAIDAIRSPQLLDPATDAMLERAGENAQAIAKTRDEAAGVRWESVTDRGVSTIEGAAQVLMGTPALLRLFSGKVRSAREVAESVINPAPRKARDAGIALAAIARWARRAEAFHAEDPARRLFGIAWRGWESDFASARALGRRLRTFESGLLRENLNVAHELTTVRQNQLAAWADRLKLELPTGDGGVALSALEAEAQRRVRDLEAALHAAQRSGAATDARLDTSLIEDIAAAQAGSASLEKAVETRPWFMGANEDPADLRAACEWVGRLRRALVPRTVLSALSAAGSPAESMLALGGLHDRGKTQAAIAEAAWTTFAAEGGLDAARFFGQSAAFTCTPLPALTAGIEAASNDQAGLRLHAELGRWLREARRLGVAEIYEASLAVDAAPNHLADAYELALVRTLLQRFLHASGDDLSQLGGTKLELVRERFRRLDQELQRAEAKRILLERQADPIPTGNGSGPVSTYTQRKLLEYVVQHVRARVTLRALAERAGAAMQAVKPVWMMSPTTAAQFAPPGKVLFDLVVIDEASQMTPEMAIGALGRGAQIVVVGDPKQLPPSNIFAVSSDGLDDDGEGEGPGLAAESILDLAYERLADRRRLKWHYRSRHEQLIQFSNREFYDGDLVTFPAAVTPNNFLGVRTVPVANGLYQGGVNEAEARVVLEEAVGLILSRPDLSLGIITMNAKQRELLFTMFEEFRASNPYVRNYIAAWEGSEEPFFIKNLENVQGDQRDVIIISTVYGPEKPNAPVLQRFGLINRKDEGHRRLNVLVTRAKCANWVVTSLRSDDVKVTPDSSRGVKAFQRYLVYAKGGATTDPEQPSPDPDSDFEIFVADKLRAHGYIVTPQVGVAGFRIDLGISHPDCPDGFLAGVECDGASYHSHYTVRDRDRIRQDVLEGLGWRIWRIWSTDWFNDSDRETGRLIEWLQSLLDVAIGEREVLRDRIPESAIADEPVEMDAVSPDARGLEQTKPPQPEKTEREEPLSRARPRPPGRPIEGLELHGGDGVYFEVTRDGELIGDIERTRGSLGPARLFGAGVRSSLPEYRATHETSGMVHITTDIYEAVRWLKKGGGDVANLEPA